MALGLCLVTASPAMADVVIGQVAPLSGVLASTGQQMVLGGKVMFDAVNARGGIHGHKIRVVVADDAYKVDETLRLTRELVADPQVVALYGFAGSANIGNLLREGVLEGAGVALVAPYTGADALRTPFNPWIFHVRASYGAETEEMIKQLISQGITRIGVLYQDDAFGQAGLAGVQAALRKRGMGLAISSPYERNTANIAAAADVIRKAEPQAVIMIAVNKPVAAFVKRYREIGGGGQLFSISVVDPAELVRLGGAEVMRGLGISQVVPYPYLPRTPLVREFHTLMAKYAPGAPINYTNFEQFIGAKVLVEALRRAGPKPTRAGVIKALESIQAYDLGGVSVGYGPNNRVGMKLVEVTVVGALGKLLK